MSQANPDAALAQNGSNRDQALDAVRTGLNESSPPLAGLQVLVLQDGDIAYEYAGGFARRGVALEREHKMRIASISKLVAAIGLMQLVEAGQVDLDADVSDYLGFKLRNPNYPDSAITPRMVLSHTSSIRDGAYYWLEFGNRFEEFFQAGAPHYDDGAHFAQGEGKQPGRFFSYANLNFGIVAAIMERASGQRFDRYMKSRVLEPMGLQASYNVCDLSASQPDLLAALWRKRDENEVWQPHNDWVAQLDDDVVRCYYGGEPLARGQQPGTILEHYVPGENPTLFSPQGGLRASARDLAVIAQMLMNGGMSGDTRILQAASVDRMFARTWHYDPALNNGDPIEGPVEDGQEADRFFNDFGLSVQRVDLEEWGLSDKPRMLLGHTGNAYGLLGLFLLEPQSGNALVALINGLGDDPGRYAGVSPLYRPEEEIVRWWLREFPR